MNPKKRKLSPISRSYSDSDLYPISQPKSRCLECGEAAEHKPLISCNTCKLPVCNRCSSDTGTLGKQGHQLLEVFSNGILKNFVYICAKCKDSSRNLPTPADARIDKLTDNIKELSNNVASLTTLFSDLHVHPYCTESGNDRYRSLLKWRTIFQAERVSTISLVFSVSVGS